jgi:hypothetical protein
LQPDQPAAQRGGDRLGDLGLADARLAFEKQRFAEFQRQVGDGAQIPAAHVILPSRSAIVSSMLPGIVCP